MFFLLYMGNINNEINPANTKLNLNKTTFKVKPIAIVVTTKNLSYYRLCGHR